MRHFVCVYYSTFKVRGMRYDCAKIPSYDERSKRDDILKALGKTEFETEIAAHEDFAAALRSVYEALTRDRTGEVYLSVVGHGPFEFGSDLKRVSGVARGAAAGHDLEAVLKPLLRPDDRIFFLTDAISVAMAGYWETYTGFQHDRSHTVASLICGIGVGGAIVQKYGRSIGRAHHSEFGHTRIHLLDQDTKPVSTCALHRGCLMGVAGWAAFEERAKRNGHETLETLFANRADPLWHIQARYIAQGCQNLMFTAPPYRIILCGHLFEVADWLVSLVAKYVREEIGEQFLYPAAQADHFIVARNLAQEALVGGIHAGLSAAQAASFSDMKGVK